MNPNVMELYRAALNGSTTELALKMFALNVRSCNLFCSYYYDTTKAEYEELDLDWIYRTVNSARSRKELAAVKARTCAMFVLGIPAAFVYSLWCSVQYFFRELPSYVRLWAINWVAEEDKDG